MTTDMIGTLYFDENFSVKLEGVLQFGNQFFSNIMLIKKVPECQSKMSNPQLKGSNNYSGKLLFVIAYQSGFFSVSV